MKFQIPFHHREYIPALDVIHIWYITLRTHQNDDISNKWNFRLFHGFGRKIFCNLCMQEKQLQRGWL